MLDPQASPARRQRPRVTLPLLLAFAALACRPDPAAETAPPQAGEQQAAANDSGEASPTTDPDAGEEIEAEAPEAEDPAAEAPEAEDPEAEDPEAEDSGAKAEDPEAEAKAEAEKKPEKKPKKKAEKKPLPKPIHKLAENKCRKSFAVGQKVKGFKLTSADGKKTISPRGYRGRVMLLNFWGTWCKPCLKELPEFDRLYRKYRRHGLTLVAVATDEDAEAVEAFGDKHKLIAKLALAGEEAAGAYNRPNFPFSFVVAPDGTIVAAYDYVDKGCLGDLELVIREQLEERNE